MAGVRELGFLLAASFLALLLLRPDISRSFEEPQRQIPAREPRRLPKEERLQQPQERRLRENESNTCRAQHKGLPIRAVQYVPHLVGEPFPFPESDPQGYYKSVFQKLHQRDLPLIGNAMQADTLRIRPWPLAPRNRNEAHAPFLELMRQQGICKLVPTFHLAKHYAEMLKQGKTSPETNSDSHLATDFIRFGGTVDGNVLEEIEMVGWSLDLSLDLFKLLPLVRTDCTLEPKDESYSMYKSMLEVIVAWVRQQGIAGSAAPALREVPLLVPLDLSQIDWTQRMVEAKLMTLLQCMEQWSSPVFGQFQDIPRTRWLLSFALPYEMEYEDCQGEQNLRCFPFETLLSQLATRLSQTNTSAVIMVGTQALKPDPSNNPNPVQDYGTETEPARQQLVLQNAYESYLRVKETHGNLDGFILDEWQDDWDRGKRGPFFLAMDTLHAMKVSCEWGGRFSHDVGRCKRPVRKGYVYPEFFGQVSATSQFLRHCSAPRLRKDAFSFNASAQDVQEGRLPLECRWLWPSVGILAFLGAFGGLLGLALLSAVGFICCGCGCCSKSSSRSARRSRYEGPAPEEAMRLHADSAGGKQVAGAVQIQPTEVKFRDERVIYKIELCSSRIPTDDEAAWRLRCHMGVQQRILEKQIQAEVLALRALRTRAKMTQRRAREEDSDEETSEISDIEDGPDYVTAGGDELENALIIVHKRVLEGVAAWCGYVCNGVWLANLQRGELQEVATSIEKNDARPLLVLFAEALLLRTMESLSEQIMHCPERLAFLFFKILMASQEQVGLLAQSSDGPCREVVFQIDLETLQDGLEKMARHSNPVSRKLMPSGWRELGINFDDINECGIQCREDVGKTFKEPSSLWVVIDFLICYRVPLILKLWSLLVAVYIYLGAGLGSDITTSFNGTLLWPQWARVNFIQYTAIADASLGACLELITLSYACWQRLPSLCYWSPGRCCPSLCMRSPGVPRLWWLGKRVVSLVMFTVGGAFLILGAKFRIKPWQCRQSDSGDCKDPRAATFEDLRDTLLEDWLYWGIRVVLFCFMQLRKGPIFIYGTPWKNARRDGGRGCRENCLKTDLVVFLLWALMLTSSIVLEIFIILPAMKGLDLNSTCGLDFLGQVIGIPAQVGECSEKENLLDFGCATCVCSVLFALTLVLVGCIVDIYFIFYIFSAIGGLCMGQYRQLNSVKRVDVPINLRPGGKDAGRFQAKIGPGWRMVWGRMVHSLLSESLIDQRMAEWLRKAAEPPGGEVDPGRLRHHEKKDLPDDKHKDKLIHLSRFPQIVAERLAFFFQSLERIQEPGDGTQVEETDKLTSPDFEPGTVPSLTQIIPCYQEMVIPTSDFLRKGSSPEDAKNQSPNDEHGIGDLTAPPLGDGVNTNLAFIISQFPDEWLFFAKRVYKDERGSFLELYKLFIEDKLPTLAPPGQLGLDLELEIRLWAAMRTHSVAKTVIGALQYQHALSSLPKIRKYYENTGKRIPEDHAELILADQTFGQRVPDGNPENDDAVKQLLRRYADDPVYLVFDVNEKTGAEVRNLVWRSVKDSGQYAGGDEAPMREGSPGIGEENIPYKYASVKCRWDKEMGLTVVEVLPRMFPLRIGEGNYKTQGKACNQMNALWFAAGHRIQALDCNMGAFIGEAFKIPYVLRRFLPLGQKNRVASRCRYLGFREYIYTGREGTVGKCHAAAEWTFGTIYQRFLSGMGIRMHYGHPDFVCAFWARNRGGMSKGSAVVNLSEDIFAGYNLHMRAEASPHVDVLEFEKGREAAFNAASLFFSKISAGSVGIIRSRDNHLLCERIGVLHSLSFYFTSVAFYVSNLLIDFSITLYVTLFIVFTLANIDLTKLSALGSSFNGEWLLSLGIMSLVPQFCEMILEFGANRACREVFGGLPASTMFFIFQNKSIAAAMRAGAISGLARYAGTGRPLANLHQTWKDNYCNYFKSHYTPSIRLMVLYIVYNLLASQTFQGQLPMFLVVISFTFWIVTPVIFAPFARCTLITQDLRDFNGFINGRAGISEAELDDLVDRGRKNKMPRTLFECGLTDAILYWTGVPCSVLLAKLVGRFVFCAALAVALPSEIMDYLWVYSVLLCFQWLLVFGFFYFNLNNILLMSSWLVWLAVFLVGRLYVIGVVGEQATTPSLWVRLPEFFISFLVFVEYLGFLHHLVLTVFRLAVAAVSEDGCFCLHMKRRIPREASNRRLHRCIRLAHVFFFSHQLHTLQAYIVLVANLMTSLFLASTDKVFCNLRIHTWWLLNSVAGDPKYLESETTWLEDANRLGLSDTSSTVTAGDTSEEANDSGSSEVGSHRRLLTAPATVPSGPERPSPATITSLGGTWPDPPFGSTWRDLGAERPSLA